MSSGRMGFGDHDIEAGPRKRAQGQWASYHTKIIKGFFANPHLVGVNEVHLFLFAEDELMFDTKKLSQNGWTTTHQPEFHCRKTPDS